MNQRASKRGQAVLFIVLALVLVFVFILIFSIMNQDEEGIVEKGKETEVNVVLNTIEGCVSRKINEEVIDFGKHWLLEESDTPVVMERPSETVFNYWNLYAPFVCNEEVYPFKDNSLILKEECNNKEAYIIHPNTNLNQGLMEYNFEELIQNELDECYSFSNEAYGFNVNPAPELSVDAKFGKNEFIVDVERSVQIDFNDGNSTKISSDVRETIDFRIGNLIAFANSVIWYDSTNLSFDPVDYNYDGFRVEINRDPDNEVDILKFIDDKSHINGQKFELWVGRENVRPIISFIPEEQIYINLSNPTQYLAESVFLDNFIGNCSTEDATDDDTMLAVENLHQYLLTEIKFYDRDEDDENLESTMRTNLNCSLFPENGDSYYSFNLELNLTDGKLNDSSTIHFRAFI